MVLSQFIATLSVGAASEEESHDDGLWHDDSYFTNDDGLWHDAPYHPTTDDGLWHDTPYF